MNLASDSALFNALPPRVLLVEDDPLVRRLAARTLRDGNVEVVEALSGDAAVERSAADTGAIDLLLCDFTLPDIDRRELVYLVRKFHPEAKVLYITAFMSELMFIAHADERVSDTFSTPVPMYKLPDVVRATLRSPYALADFTFSV